MGEGTCLAFSYTFISLFVFLGFFSSPGGVFSSRNKDGQPDTDVAFCFLCSMGGEAKLTVLLIATFTLISLVTEMPFEMRNSAQV